MKLSEVVEKYCATGRLWAAHEHLTFVEYLSKLRRFQRWVEQQGLGDPELEQIPLELLETYCWEVIPATGVRARTHRQHIHALRFLYRYAFVKLRVIDQDLMQEKDREGKHCIPLPDLDDPERRMLSDDELQAVLEAATRSENPFKVARDRAVVATLIFTGIRRAELLGLMVSDLDLQRRSITVLRKGKKRRQEIFLCSQALDALHFWMRYREENRIDHPSLFLMNRGRPLGECGLAKLLKELGARAGLKNKDAVQPHTIRHRAASRFMANGATLSEVQALLGHSSPRVTELYLHLEEQAIKQKVELLSFSATIREVEKVEKEEGRPVVSHLSTSVTDAFLSAVQQEADRPPSRPTTYTPVSQRWTP